MATTPSSGVDGLHERKGAIILVAICASLSFFATVGLLLYVVIFSIRARVARVSAAMSSGLMFWRTQFGVLFLNLVVSDLIQATGFLLGWHWIATDMLPERLEGNAVCSIQGGLIQAGDVASAIWSVIIALHTAGILVFRFKPSNAVLGTTVGGAWAVIVLLTFIGPAVIQKVDLGPFYSAAGNWCWIQSAYDPWRLWIHYLLLFIAGLANVVIYVIIYIKVRRDEHLWASIAPKKPREEALIAAAEAPVISKIRGMDASEARAANHVARRMLIFPIAYLITIIPLSSYRIAGLLGHNWGYKWNAACGCIFTLAGLINVLVYSTTRRFFQRRSQNKDPFEKTCGSVARRGSILLGAADEKAIPRGRSFDMISLPMGNRDSNGANMGMGMTNVYSLPYAQQSFTQQDADRDHYHIDIGKDTFTFDDRARFDSQTELVHPSDSVSQSGHGHGAFMGAAGRMSTASPTPRITANPRAVKEAEARRSESSTRDEFTFVVTEPEEDPRFVAANGGKASNRWSSYERLR